MSTLKDSGLPRINVGTIGHVDHGKTTLTAAITHTIAFNFPNSGNKSLDYDNIDNAPEEKARGITINQRTVNYNTDKFSFSHVDCPGHADYVKNMITGTSQMDVAILVVAATDSVCPQTREHVILAKRVGVKHMVVFLNKCDVADSDFVDMTEEEVKELLEINGYDLEKVYFFRGSALKALQGDKANQQVILDMIETISTKIELPKRDREGTFKMYIDNKFSITGRGTVLTGLISSGTIKKEDTLQLIGTEGKPKDIRVISIEAFHKICDEAYAGFNVGILVKGVEYDEVERGMILCTPNTIKTHQEVTAEILLLKKAEGGRHSPIKTGYRPQFFIGTGDFTGSIDLLGEEDLLPGSHATIKIKFHCKVPVDVGTEFVIREGGTTVGAGKITAIGA